MAVVRFGVSLQEDQLEALDNYVRDSQFANRSQAFRQLISKNLVENKWQHNKVVAGVITLIYNHHKRDLTLILTDIQHNYYDIILSTQHFHLDHDKCLEIVAIKGKALRLTELSDKLIAVKGIQHGELAMSTVD